MLIIAAIVAGMSWQVRKLEKLPLVEIAPMVNLLLALLAAKKIALIETTKKANNFQKLNNNRD